MRSGSPRARRAGARGRARGKVPRGVRIDVRRTSARQALVASNDAVTGPHGVGHEPTRAAAGRADPTALEAPTARRDAAAAPHRASCLFLTSTGVRFARGGLVIDVGIALWLGHEQIETTQIYLHADLALKERDLARTTPAHITPGRYRPPDTLLAFLEAL